MILQIAESSPAEPITERAEALKRIAPRIDMEQMESFIDQVPGISDLQKAFYKAYVNARYELIIRPALELVTAEIGPTQTM